MCVRACGSLSPHPLSPLPAHSLQLCHLPSHFTSRRWQPSISASITLPASPARRLHYLTKWHYALLRHPLTLLYPLHRGHILPPLILHLPPSKPSIRLSLPGCRVSLHINRTLVTAFSASSCLLSPSRCSISSIMFPTPPTLLTVVSLSPLLFAPSVSVSPFSHHLPLFRFVLPVLCPPVCLNYLQYLSPSPPPFLILPPSPPSLPFLFLSESSSPHLLPVLPHLAISLRCARHSSRLLSSPHPFLSSLSISLSAIDGGAGCRPETRRGWRERRGFPVCPFLQLSPLFLFLSVRQSRDLPFLPVFFFFLICMPSPFLQHSLCCHSAVCLYFPCCQLRAWPLWQPWQLQTLCGPRYSLSGTPAERKEKGGRESQ